MKITREVKTALVVIVAALLSYIGYNFLANNSPFSSSRTFYVVYKDVGGLSSSSKITINGYKIGQVKKISFSGREKGKLLVTLNVKKDFKFSKSSIAQIYGGGFIGGKSIAILPKYKGPPAKPGDTLKGKVKKGLMEIVSDRLSPLQKKIEKFVTSADSLLSSVNRVFDRETRESLKGAIVNLDSTMNNLSALSSNLEGLMAKNSGKLNKTFSNLKETSGNFRKFSDSLSQLEIQSTVHRLNQVAANLEEVSTDLKNGKGTLGKLLQNDEVYVNLKNATQQMKELLQDIKLNPGRYVHFSVFGGSAEPYEEPEDSLK